MSVNLHSLLIIKTPTSGTAPGLYLGTYKGYDEQVRRSSEDILYAGLIWPSVSYLLAFYFLNLLIYLFKGYWPWKQQAPILSLGNEVEAGHTWYVRVCVRVCVRERSLVWGTFSVFFRGSGSSKGILFIAVPGGNCRLLKKRKIKLKFVTHNSRIV